MKNNFIDIPGFSGRYKINRKGEVLSVRRAGTSGKLLKQAKHKGYRRVGLYSGKKVINFSVHRLIASAFIPNPKDKPFINHKDGNKRNNNVSNLEWVTAKENYDHSVDVLGRNGKGKNNGHFGYSKAKLYPSEELRNRLVELGIPRYKHNLAELGEMLPDGYKSYFCNKKWNMDGDPTPSGGIVENTEANARAKMLIYLKERK